MPVRHGLLIASVLLAGCVKPAVKPPAVVKVPIVQYVAVPDELTKACPVAMPQSRTVAEAVRVARARRDSLEQCNRQLDAIQALPKE